MKTITRRTFALTLALSCFALVGCDNRAQVKVQVFVTTQEGENIKLGNVPIYVVEEDWLLQTFRQPANNYAATSQAGFIKILDAVANGMRVGQRVQYGTMTREYEGFKTQFRKTAREYVDFSHCYVHDSLEISFRKSNDSGVYTDADGMATVVVPNKNKTYYIFASTTRAVGNTTERYCWLEPVREGEPKQVRLSNNNLWDAAIQGKNMGFYVLPELPDYPEYPRAIW